MNVRPGTLETALFAIAFALSGLVLLALVWSGAGAYEQIALSNGVGGTALVARGSTGATEEVRVDLGTLVEYHRQWTAYVTGGVSVPPVFGRALFTSDEYAHMADVRRVFDAAKILIPAGLFVMAVRLQRARALGGRVALRLVRDGTIVAAVAVAIVALGAVFAFAPLFLLFHAVFFPEGNFLFDPATSNLVRLYPEWYWEGVTFRVGLSFLGLAAAVGGAAGWGLRRARSTRLGAA